jgi:putative glycosyltransferase (TIGR04372 family)
MNAVSDRGGVMTDGLVIRDGSRTVFVAPSVPEATFGQFSTTMLATLARARDAHAAAAFLPTPSPWRPEWFRTVDGPAFEPLRGRLAARGRARWYLDRTRARMAGTRRRARTVWSREMHRELRRQAGDERLPARSRMRFKEAARRALTWAPAAGPQDTAFPRRLLRERIVLTLTNAARAEGDGLAGAAGLPAGAPIVAFEVPARMEAVMPAIACLTGLGYTVVRVGSDSGGRLDMSGVIDVASQGLAAPLLDVWLLLRARFLVCQSADWQQAAYLTNTPTVRYDARDPFAAYPVRTDGLLLLARAVDLESGRTLSLDERLSDDYFDRLRNIGHASCAADELADAAREMHEPLSAGGTDTAGQAEFRVHATNAAVALAPEVPYVAEWGADRGFLGDGRLARVQARGAVA